jgi:hypothetical protein
MKRKKNKIVYILQICQFLNSGSNIEVSVYGVFSSLKAAKRAMFNLKGWSGKNSRKKMFWKILDVPLDNDMGWVFYNSAYSPHHFAPIDVFNTWSEILKADKNYGKQTN